MNKSSAQDQTPGGFEGRAAMPLGNPTPTASHDSLRLDGSNPAYGEVFCLNPVLNAFAELASISLTIALGTICFLQLGIALGFAQSFPGGFLETQGTGSRTKYTAPQIAGLVPPGRDWFTFPAPYGTEAYRLTIADDCQQLDCVNYTGYSYWMNINNHAGQAELQIFLGLAPARLGTGPNLFRVNKTTNAVTKVGPLFAVGSPYRNHTTESWYWSTALPNAIYMIEEPSHRRLLRYDVSTSQFIQVFTILGQGLTSCATASTCDKFITQPHSDATDTNHVASLHQTPCSGCATVALGCVTYNTATLVFRFYPKVGNYDECLLDKSGRWTTLLEDVNPNATGCGTNNSCDDNDLVVFDNTTGLQVITYTGPVNTPGHTDGGFNYIVTQDGHNALESATIRWDYSTSPTVGPLLHRSNDWSHPIMLHPSHQNARSGVAFSQQFFCGSGADRTSFRNEVTCAKLDGSTLELIVAPIMTNLDAAGGCCAGDYSKFPKGNLDVTGRYFIWTTNLGGTRLDAFLVKVPSQLLVADETPPSSPTGLSAN
jgi:hypothetical protein